MFIICIEDSLSSHVRGSLPAQTYNLLYSSGSSQIHNFIIYIRYNIHQSGGDYNHL